MAGGKDVITLDELRYIDDPRVSAGYVALAALGYVVILGSDEEAIAEGVEAQYGDDPRQKAALMQGVIR